MNALQCSLAVLFLLVRGAHAQTINKCVSGAGAVSWQSEACAKDMRMVRRIAYTADAPATVRASMHPQTKAASKSPTTKSRYMPGYRLSTRARRPKLDACARARVHRETTLDRVGLKRNYDLLRKLDTAVWRVCR